MLSHPTGNMGRDHMSIRQFNPKHGVGQGLDDNPFHFDMFFLRHALSLNCGRLIISHVVSKYKLECWKKEGLYKKLHFGVFVHA